MPPSRSLCHGCVAAEIGQSWRRDVTAFAHVRQPGFSNNLIALVPRCAGAIVIGASRLAICDSWVPGSGSALAFGLNRLLRHMVFPGFVAPCSLEPAIASDALARARVGDDCFQRPSTDYLQPVAVWHLIPGHSNTIKPPRS